MLHELYKEHIIERVILDVSWIYKLEYKINLAEHLDNEMIVSVGDYRLFIEEDNIEIRKPKMKLYN